MQQHDDAVEQALLQLVRGYAQAMDRNDPELLLSLLAEEAVVEGPGFRLQGKTQIGAAPAMLKQRYRRTRHLVHQMLARVEGESAQAETYAEACHVYDDPAAGTQALIWHLRYQDEFVKRGRWLFSRRRLLIDWTETRRVDVPPA